MFNPNKWIKIWDCPSSFDYKEQAWKWETGWEIERNKNKKLWSSERIHKNEKDGWWETPWSKRHEWDKNKKRN